MEKEQSNHGRIKAFLFLKYMHKYPVQVNLNLSVTANIFHEKDTNERYIIYTTKSESIPFALKTCIIIANDPGNIGTTLIKTLKNYKVLGIGT